VRRRTGFAVVELLVASVILLVLTGGLFAVLAPGPSASRARASAIDIQQRLRAAAEAVGAEVSLAGNGPSNGASGQPFGAMAASVLPFRVGPRGDPDGTARVDALTVLSVKGVEASATLLTAWVPSGGGAFLSMAPGCPAADASCGFRAGGAALLLDGHGQADLFRVDDVAGNLLSLSPRGRTSGRGFPAGSVVVPVAVSSYYLKPATASDGAQLMSGDGDQSDMPLVDHVTRLSFELFGEPRAPVLQASASPPRASYGPAPPLPSEDDLRDTWGTGENCTFVLAAGGQVSRLPSVAGGTGLVPMSPAMLTDGPWCPDASAPGRYDADLFRVRAVRVTVRVEASSSASRGRDAALFAHPGSSRDSSAPAADQQIVFDIVPRALQRAR